MLKLRKKIIEKICENKDLPITEVMEARKDPLKSIYEENEFDEYFKNKNNFFAELRSLITEINGDFLILREKKISHELGAENIKILNNIIRKLNSIYSMHNMNLFNPYIGAEEIIRMVNKERSRLELLDSLIQKYLDEKKVGLGFQKYIIEAQVNGIKNLIEFAKKLEFNLKNAKGHIKIEYPEHEEYITEEFERTRAPAEEETGVFRLSKNKII